MGKLNPFSFVIVGSGNISRTYVSAVDNLPGIEIVGVVSRKGNRPENLSENADVEISDSISGIKRNFDAVILTTPNGLHHKGAIEAAKLGKHVLTEKPLDISIKNMDAMMDACTENNVRLGVCFQSRMSPDNITIKKLIDEQKLGRIFAADLDIKYYRDDAYYNSGDYRGGYAIDGGGPFIQQGSHNIDIYCWFFGMPETVISAVGTFTHDIEAEDHGVALLKHENGMIGTITASTSCKPGFSPKLEIHSNKGTIIQDNGIITMWEIEGVENPCQIPDRKLHDGATSAAVADTSGHEAIIQDFVQAVREEKEPAVSASSARLATELVLKIYESSIE